MADGVDGMESAVPAKRPRLDFSDNASTPQCDNNFQCFAATSELMSSSYNNAGEFTLTTDSGFNELTPPRSMEDDATNPSCEGGSVSGPEETVESSQYDVEIDAGGTLSNPPSSCNPASTSSSNPGSCLHSDQGPFSQGTEGDNTGDDDDDDRQSVTSTASNISGLSEISNFSGKEWKPCAGPMTWVQRQMMMGVDPRTVLTQILGATAEIPIGVSDMTLWRIIVNMLSEPPRREKLRHINTIDDVVRLMKSCKKIIVLTGAGVSVSCGIPDFRSRDGIYARLAVDFPDLPDPQAMFDIHYFRRDPRPFFKFAREIYPGQFTPSLCHRFIRVIEQHNKLLRNYTQNIDTLEQAANIKNVIQCHGSFATATCQKCGHKVEADAIKDEIFDQVIPLCRICCPEGIDTTEETQHILPQEPSVLQQTHQHLQQEGYSPPIRPIMKPDIVFFGEGLPDEFHDRMAEDKDECDLLIVIGSSLKVRPVALIPSSIPAHVPQILINREPLRHLTFDVELMGDCDVIISELCRRLESDWSALSQSEPMTEIRELPPRRLPPGQGNGTKSKGGEGGSSGDTPLMHPQDAPHPKDESDIEALRACWAPKIRESVSERLPANMFLYSGTYRYIFPGAEVYYDPDEEFEEDNKSHSSDSDTEDDEDQTGKEEGDSGGGGGGGGGRSGDEDEEDDEDEKNGLSSLMGSNHTDASSSHHPRLGDREESVERDVMTSSRSSTSAPHLSPEDVDSLLSTADGHDHDEDVEDWTSLNASLDTTLDCEVAASQHHDFTHLHHHTSPAPSSPAAALPTTPQASPSAAL